MEFFSSIEFYILAFAIAFAIVGITMKPSERGPAKTFFAHGFVDDNTTEEPGIIIGYDGDTLKITHTGVDIRDKHIQFNYAITIIGNDITVNERTAHSTEPVDCLTDRIDITMTTERITPGRYHLKFTADWQSQWASTRIVVAEPFTKRIAIRQ